MVKIISDCGYSMAASSSAVINILEGLNAVAVFSFIAEPLVMATESLQCKGMFAFSMSCCNPIDICYIFISYLSAHLVVFGNLEDNTIYLFMVMSMSMMKWIMRVMGIFVPSVVFSFTIFYKYDARGKVKYNNHT